MREILVRKIVHLDTKIFISIMFEHGFSKIRISQTHSASYSDSMTKLGVWFSQEWKSDELMEVGTVRLVVCPQRRTPQHTIIDDEAKSDLSLGSKSFLHRVNGQGRKRQKRSSMNIMENGENIL